MCYRNDQGEEISFTTTPLYDLVTSQLEKFDLFMNLIQSIDLDQIKFQDDLLERIGHLGTLLYEDVLKEITSLWGFIKKEVGDIQIDSALYRQAASKGGKLLGAYIKK
jgi:hypothetical protein